MLMAPAMAESAYCIPKSDGTYRFATTGSACPVGYFSTGKCCEALHQDTPRAVPKISGTACPSGWFASGGECASLRR
jgi:hypothetical protein